MQQIVCDPKSVLSNVQLVKNGAQPLGRASNILRINDIKRF